MPKRVVVDFSTTINDFHYFTEDFFIFEQFMAKGHRNDWDSMMLSYSTVFFCKWSLPMSLRVWNIWLADNAWAPALTHYYNLQLMSLPSLLLTHRVIKCFGLHKTQKGYLNRFWRRWRLVGWFLGRVNIPQYLNSMNLNVIRVQGREYAFENKFRWF